MAASLIDGKGGKFGAAELRRIANLVNEDRARIVAVDSESVRYIRNSLGQGFVDVQIKIELTQPDLMEIVCKTLTREQAAQEAERESVKAAERMIDLLAGKIDP